MRIASKFARDFDCDWQHVKAFSYCVTLIRVLFSQIISNSDTKVPVLVVMECKRANVIYVYELIFLLHTSRSTACSKCYCKSIKGEHRIKKNITPILWRSCKLNKADRMDKKNLTYQTKVLSIYATQQSKYAAKICHQQYFYQFIIPKAMIWNSSGGIHLLQLPAELS